MTNASPQIQLFQHIKMLLPPHLSMVDEIADTLNISTDSAYRRIRAEKPLSLEELKQLCVKYHLSVDAILQLQTGNYLFTGNVLQKEPGAFQNWLDSLHQQLMFMNSFGKKHMYWLLKDVSPFTHFHITELAIFKFYLWMKSIFHFDEMKGVKFDLGDKRYEPYIEKSRLILQTFNKITSTDIWNVESINSTLRQIHFHHESGSFRNPADVSLLYRKLEELVNHIELQAEYGKKFNIGEAVPNGGADFNMFVNELILGDNSIFLEADNLRMTFLNHSVLYFIYTKDEAFNQRTYNNLQNLMQKSTLISKVGEKERIAFFNRLRAKIRNRLKGLS